MSNVAPFFPNTQQSEDEETALQQEQELMRRLSLGESAKQHLENPAVRTAFATGWNIIVNRILFTPIDPAQPGVGEAQILAARRELDALQNLWAHVDVMHQDGVEVSNEIRDAYERNNRGNR